MARVKSLFRVRGRIGDVQFFESDGEKFVREDGSISKQRIMTDAAFKRTRENMAEFGASAKAGSAMRRNLSKVIGSFKDRYVSSRITAAMRQILAHDTGIRGQRSILVSAHKERLAGFEFHRSDRFTSAFSGEYSIAVPAGRESATLTIPDFAPDKAMDIPAGATHFRFVLAIGVLSDYQYDVAAERHMPMEPVLELLDANVGSVYYSVDSPVGLDIILTATLPGSPVMTVNSSLMVCIGVEFYQMIGATQYLLSQGNAMRIEQVF